MPPHQQRVLDEQQQLDERLTKLQAFFATALFAGLDRAERDRLREQAGYMSAYNRILLDRIAAFPA